MWKLIYNILAHLALPVFLLYGVINKKIRRNIGEKLSATTRGLLLKNCVWIHAASVGEAVIAQNIVAYMKANHGLRQFIITTNTYYTRDMLKAKYKDEIPVFSLPIDISYLVRRFIAGSFFRILIVIETELWPNLLWQAKAHGIPVVIVNGRLSDRTIATYRRLSLFLSSVLRNVDHVAAQSEQHKARFVSLGMNPQNITVTGNVKYCRFLRNEDKTYAKGMAVTFGSVKEKELNIVLPIIKSLKEDFPQTEIYIAPRELHLTTVIQEELSRFFEVFRFSGIKQGATTETGIVVVDTIGDLVDIYAKSLVAFVGGSLAPYGGQNILEPLFFGTPVVFGPYMENFADIAETVLQQGAGIMVKDGHQLYVALKNILTDKKLQADMGAAGTLVIDRQQEAMHKTVDIIMRSMRVSNDRKDGAS